MTTGHAVVLMVDSGPPSAQRALDALPWVSVATFERRWPWTLVILVKERLPVARVATSGGGDVVDKSGRVLEVGSTQQAGSGPIRPMPALPVIMGVLGAPAGADISPGVGLTRPDMAELLAAAAAAPQALAERNLRLAYTAADRLVGYVGRTKAVVLLGDASDLPFKLAVLEELTTRVNLASYSQVDLTVPERPALTPMPSGVLSLG
jgi:cell division septal protein FtsQ